MANLKRLIEGQNVRFDTHQAGDAQSINWNHLHLEKIIHKDKGGGKIRFPLTGGYEPNWSPRVSRKQYEKVRREVQRELRKNKQLIDNLAETVVEVLHKYSSGEASIETCKVAAKKLAGYFGLDEKFVRVVEEYANDRLFSFTSYHVNPGNRMLEEIKLTPKKVEIRRSRRSNRDFNMKQ